MAGPAGHLAKRLETGAAAASQAAAGEGQPAPGLPAEGEPVAPRPGPREDASLNDQWQAFLQFVQEKENGPLFGKLAQSRLVGMKDHCLKIALGRPWTANGARHEARLQELARTFFGPETTLEFEVEAPKTPKSRPAAAPKPLDLKQLQQQALEIFGGEWLGSPRGKEESE